jgi:hypothetical protein
MLLENPSIFSNAKCVPKMAWIKNSEEFEAAFADNFLTIF